MDFSFHPEYERNLIALDMEYESGQGSVGMSWSCGGTNIFDVDSHEAVLCGSNSNDTISKEDDWLKQSLFSPNASPGTDSANSIRISTMKSPIKSDTSGLSVFESNVEAETKDKDADNIYAQLMAIISSSKEGQCQSESLPSINDSSTSILCSEQSTSNVEVENYTFGWNYDFISQDSTMNEMLKDLKIGMKSKREDFLSFENELSKSLKYDMYHFNVPIISLDIQLSILDASTGKEYETKSILLYEHVAESKVVNPQKINRVTRLVFQDTSYNHGKKFFALQVTYSHNGTNLLKVTSPKFRILARRRDDDVPSHRRFKKNRPKKHEVNTMKQMKIEIPTAYSSSSEMYDTTCSCAHDFKMQSCHYNKADVQNKQCGVKRKRETNSFPDSKITKLMRMATYATSPIIPFKESFFQLLSLIDSLPNKEDKPKAKSMAWIRLSSSLANPCD